MSKRINNIKKSISRIAFISSMMMSCTHQNINETYIVPKDTMPLYNGSDPKIPPPPPPRRAYYFPSNFIVDTLGEIFFYQKPGKWNDDEQVDWNTPPKFINLKPEDIVQIPAGDIEEFIKLNILNIDSSKRYIAIASEKDTIKSLGLSKIIAMCEDKNYHIRWKFRVLTQEEAIVLDYKKRHEIYKADEIKWDSSKIRMPTEIKEK